MQVYSLRIPAETYETTPRSTMLARNGPIAFEIQQILERSSLQKAQESRPRDWLTSQARKNIMVPEEHRASMAGVGSGLAALEVSGRSI